MGRLSQHPGHNSQARQRIDTAREHYQTRAERRVNKAPSKTLQDYLNKQYAKNPGLKESVDKLVEEMLTEQDSL